jgi:hypothetical protein
VRVGIRAEDPAILDALRDYLPPGWTRASSAVVDHLYYIRAWPGRKGSTYRLYTGSETIVASRHLRGLETALETLRTWLDAMLCVFSRRGLFVHAGVVGWRGRAILIPGRSRSGKTTLVAAMVRAGATYYSDEYAVIDARGRVHPYARPLFIRSRRGQRSRPCPVEALGGRAGRRPLPVGLIAVTAYHREARWRPRQLSPGEALLALLDNTVTVRRQPDVVLPTLRRAVGGARAIRTRRTEADVIAPALLDMTVRPEGELVRGGKYHVGGSARATG